MSGRSRRSQTQQKSDVDDKVTAEKSGTKRARDSTSATASVKKSRKASQGIDGKTDDAYAVDDEAQSSRQSATKQSKGEIAHTSSTGTGNYWLMKAEQEDREVQAKNGSTINAKFTIDDLKAKKEPEPWDGVRNVVARNNMRAMKVGDLAFFYASGGKGSLKPGITGIMKVVKEHEVDWTMYDEGAYGYTEPKDRGPDEAPKWSLVHVEFVQKLETPVSLAELRSHSQAGGALADMQLLRNGRISVSKMSKEEWDFIHEKLISAD